MDNWIDLNNWKKPGSRQQPCGYTVDIMQTLHWVYASTVINENAYIRRDSNK